MLRLILLSLLQCTALACGQLTLKLAMERMAPFEWSVSFWTSLLTNWWFAACGLLFGGASLLWMYILKHWPLSQAYPMASLSFVIALIMAATVLHEDITWNRWLGVALIMLGCIFVAR